MALAEEFDNARSSFVLNATQVALAQKEAELPPTEESSPASNTKQPLFIPDDDDATGAEQVGDIALSEPNSEVESTEDNAGLPIEQELENASTPSEDPRPLEKRPRSASPDPVADEETRPLKKVAVARSPSPALVSAPALSTAAPQRLAGPGRTPARVEQILSTDTSGTGRGVQMVLDTSGASWNLKPGHEGPQRKRPPLADVSGSSSGKNARISMRARLAGFARDGVRTVRDEQDDESPEEDELAEDEVETAKRSLKNMDIDDDVNGVDDKVSSSTDVVDETMAVDLPESEDEAPKLKLKPKPKARTPTSATTSTSAKRASGAEPTSSEEVLLLDNSSSASAPPSNTAATTASSSRDAVSGVRTEIVRTVIGPAPPLAFDLERTTSVWSAYLERSAGVSAPQPALRSSELGHADLAADNENATATLARVLSKADFESMRVVGQFNRGFIVARLRGAANDDLFIVDQHAADEKYNFETLQATTRLESQRLFTCVCYFFTIVCNRSVDHRDGTARAYWS